MAAIVNRALAHERDGHRHVEAPGECPQLGSGIPPQDAVAGQHEWPLGGRDEPRGVGERLLCRLGEVGVRRLHGPELVGHRLGRNVLGQLDVGRPGLLQLGHPEGLAHDLRDRASLLDSLVPLGHRFQHPDDVDELMGLLVDLVRAGLAGEGDHGRPIQEGIRDARHQVRGAGPQGGHRNGGPAGQPAMDVRHECRALLVAGRNVPDAGRLSGGSGQGIQDVHGLLAGHREDVVAAFGREALDQERRRVAAGRGVGHRG